MTREIVLVDGAGGFLGKRVVGDLLEAGYKVRATDLPSTDLSYAEKLGAEVVYADLLEPKSLENAVSGALYVVHCAALFSLDASGETLYKVNVTGTENLLNAVKGKGIKHFVHVSSSDVYGTLKTLPGDENHAQNPINDYAVSKKESEEIVLRYSKEHNLPVTILRPSAIYGPGSTYIAGVFFFWPILMRILRIPFFPYIKGGSKLTFVHIDDVSGAIRFLLGRSETFGEAYNVADDEYIYSANFACELCRAFGIRNMLPFAIPLPHLLVDLYGKFMLLVSGPILSIMNRFVKKRWVKLQRRFNLYPGFIPHFERQFYSYFIGHRYFTSKKLEGLGYNFKNKSFLQGFPGTFEWYLKNRWIPSPGDMAKKT